MPLPVSCNDSSMRLCPGRLNGTALIASPIALPQWERQVFEGVPELIGQPVAAAKGLSVRYRIFYIG